VDKAIDDAIFDMPKKWKYKFLDTSIK
jgi:hypothetical protein